MGAIGMLFVVDTHVRPGGDEVSINRGPSLATDRKELCPAGSSEIHLFPINRIILAELTLKFNGTPDSDPIFSKKRVAETLTYGYFEMLGTLSKHQEGVKKVG